MEAVGSAAAILQLAGAATKTSIQVYEFITTIKNAPREVENLGRDIMNFHQLVSNLAQALDSREIRDLVDQNTHISRSMKNLRDPMAKCQINCDLVQSKLSLHLQLEESVDSEKARLLRSKDGSAIIAQKKSRT